MDIADQNTSLKKQLVHVLGVDAMAEFESLHQQISINFTFLMEKKIFPM